MEIKKPVSNHPLPPHAKQVFKGVMFDVYQWEQPMFDGTTATFEKLTRPDTVMIIPVTEDGQIMVLEETQPGTKPFISLPGGRLEPQEDPLTAAKRELLEETGYEAQEYVLWDAVQPVVKIEWAIYTFIAKGCKKVTEPKLDSGEKNVLKSVSFDEFIEMVLDEKFRDLGIVKKILQAKVYPQKMTELKELLK